MVRFVEFHQPNSSGPTPVMVNVEWIEYIIPLKEGALLYLGTINVEGQQDQVGSRPYTIHVTEDYYTIKEIFQCQ